MSEIIKQFEFRLQNASNIVDIEAIINEALKDHSVLKLLVDYLTHPHKQVAMHAAWALTHCSDRKIKSVEPYHAYFVSVVWHMTNESAKRSVLRTLSFLPLIDEMDGNFFDKTLQYIISKSTPIANKAFSIDILMKYVAIYPELASEIYETLNLAILDASPGVLNKIKKTKKILTTLQATL